MPRKDQKKEPTPTEERIRLPGSKRDSVVYVGSRGGKYVRKGGNFVSLKGMKGGWNLFGKKEDVKQIRKYIFNHEEHAIRDAWGEKFIDWDTSVDQKKLREINEVVLLINSKRTNRTLPNESTETRGFFEFIILFDKIEKQKFNEPYAIDSIKKTLALIQNIRDNSLNEDFCCYVIYEEGYYTFYLISLQQIDFLVRRDHGFHSYAPDVAVAVATSQNKWLDLNPIPTNVVVPMFKVD